MEVSYELKSRIRGQVEGAADALVRNRNKELESVYRKKISDLDRMSAEIYKLEHNLNALEQKMAKSAGRSLLKSTKLPHTYCVHTYRKPNVDKIINDIVIELQLMEFNVDAIDETVNSFIKNMKLTVPDDKFTRQPTWITVDGLHLSQ